jgi:hypothetical protein
MTSPPTMPRSRASQLISTDATRAPVSFSSRPYCLRAASVRGTGCTPGSGASWSIALAIFVAVTPSSMTCGHAATVALMICSLPSCQTVRRARSPIGICRIARMNARESASLVWPIANRTSPGQSDAIAAGSPGSTAAMIEPVAPGSPSAFARSGVSSCRFTPIQPGLGLLGSSR